MQPTVNVQDNRRETNEVELRAADHEETRGYSVYECDNCRQTVPESNLLTHEALCRRRHVPQPQPTAPQAPRSPPRLTHSTLSRLISIGSRGVLEQAEENKKDDVAAALLGISAARINRDIALEESGALKDSLISGTMPPDEFQRYSREGRRHGNVLTALSPAPPAPPTCFCPITRELFVDPVICSDSFTYERYAILEWIKTQMRADPNVAPTSPMARIGLELSAPTDRFPNGTFFRPNLAMRQTVEDWLEQTRTQPTPSPVPAAQVLERELAIAAREANRRRHAPDPDANPRPRPRPGPRPGPPFPWPGPRQDDLRFLDQITVAEMLLLLPGGRMPGRLVEWTDEAVSKVLARVTVLCRETENQAAFAPAQNFWEWVSAIVLPKLRECTSRDIVLQGCNAITALCKDAAPQTVNQRGTAPTGNEINKAQLIALRVPEIIVIVLQSGTGHNVAVGRSLNPFVASAALMAAQILAFRNDEAQQALGGSDEACLAVIRVIELHDANPQVASAGATAIANIAFNKPNIAAILVHNGACRVMVQVLRSFNQAARDRQRAGGDEALFHACRALGDLVLAPDTTDAVMEAGVREACLAVVAGPAIPRTKAKAERVLRNIESVQRRLR